MAGDREQKGGSGCRMRAIDPGGGSWNWSGSMEILHNLSSSLLTMNGAGRREFRIE